MIVEIALLMDLPPNHDFHRATRAALDHAGVALAVEVSSTVVRTRDWDGASEVLRSGVIVGPGSPYEVEGAAYSVIRHARERDLPLVGT